MNDLEHIELTVATPVSSPQAIEGTAADRLQAINAQLATACANEFVLEQSWVRLGRLLVQSEALEDWRPLGFGSFEDFMTDLRQRYKRGRSSLWSYLTAAKVLLPILPAEALEHMGIKKALELKRGLAQGGGKPLPAEVIADALNDDKTVPELRAAIGRAFNLAPDDKGTWFDLQGFYATKEERAEFVNCVRMTMSLNGIRKDIPEHIQRKELFMAWVREFWATHAAEVYGPSEQVNTPAKLMLPAAQVHDESI